MLWCFLHPPPAPLLVGWESAYTCPLSGVSIVGRKWLHRDTHIWNLKTHDCVTFHGKRNFADVIMLRIWDERITLGYVGGPAVITWVPVRGRQECRSLRWRCSDRCRESESEIWRCGIASFEGWERDHKPRNKVTTRGWARPASRSHPRAPESRALQTPWSWLHDTHFGLLPFPSAHHPELLRQVCSFRPRNL